MEQEELSVRQASEYSREHDTKRRGLSVSYIVRAIKEGKIVGHYVETPAVSYYMVNKVSLDGYLKSERKPGVKPGSKRKAKAGQPTQTTEAPLAQPDRPVVAGEKPPAQETTIDIEGAHIRIDPLLPAGERWLEAEAIADDMRAVMYLRPYGTRASVYTLEGSYDRAETYAPGRMGRKQEQRGQALLALLEKHMRAALVAAGWQTEERAGNELWRYTGSEAKQ